MTTKVHIVADGKGRSLSMVITGGDIDDTIMRPRVLGDISVPLIDMHTPIEVEAAYYADLESAHPAPAGQTTD